ncbi:MAG: hypothetical protein OHK0022_48240 [Roseiflexaceae bacterium]
MRVRHIRPDDDGLLVEFFDRLSLETRQQRFMTTREHVPAEEVQREARRLAVIDPRYEAALVAVVEEHGAERIVGVARFVGSPDDPQLAEFAIVIRDDYQREGLGSILLDLLIQVALARGIDCLVGVTLLENTGIQRLVRRLGLPLSIQTRRGETTMTIRLGFDD